MACYWNPFPYSLPAPIGGPDYPNKPRDRRPEEAPVFGPVAHLQSLARRVESSIRNSWDLVPGVRRITTKWHSVWSSTLLRRWRSKPEELKKLPRAAWVEAARQLYRKLQRRTYAQHVWIHPCSFMTAAG